MGRLVTRTLTPLGWMLRQTLLRRAMSQENFAKRIGVHGHKVRSIIYRGSKITPEMATKFEAVLGTSASTWLRLQDEICFY